jgi:biopolymer transport protein ExbD
MKVTRRMKRMGRSRKPVPGMSLTSLMDVFTILVFFLLVNSSSAQNLESPKNIALPASVVQTKPNETVVIMVSEENVLVQGEMVALTQDIVDSKQEYISAISDKLEAIKKNVIGINTKANSTSREVTILSDKTIKFKVLKKIMASSTYAGYEKISMAVIQKATQAN